jgi:ribosomal protein L15
MLQKLGLLGSRDTRPIKILSGGTISFPLMTEGLLVSAEARAKIEKAGGKVG